MTQSPAKGQSSPRIDGHLNHAFQLVFDGVFNRDNLKRRAVNMIQGRIERCCFTAARRPGHQNNTVSLAQRLIESIQHLRTHAQVIQSNQGIAAVQNTHHDRLPPHGRNRRNTQIHFAATGTELNMSILRNIALRNIHSSHNLDT